MPTIVDFPTIVQEALTVFGDMFDTEAARRHFAERSSVTERYHNFTQTVSVQCGCSTPMGATR